MLRGLPETQQEYRSHFSNVKVLCLSEINDNILMWSHYSEHHRGVMLAFRCVAEIDSVFGAAQPVVYCERMPRLFDDNLLIKMLSGQANANVREIYDKSVLSKAKDWAYEKEWRLVLNKTHAEQDYEDIRFSPQELATIYLGCQMPQEDRFELIAMASRHFPKTRIFQAKKHETEFKIEFEGITALVSQPD